LLQRVVRAVPTIQRSTFAANAAGADGRTAT
jgi:hypothetical protein